MNALGDFEFETSQFLDYLQPIFSSLFVLLKEAKECDTKVSSVISLCPPPVQCQCITTNNPFFFPDVHFEHNVRHCRQNG